MQGEQKHDSINISRKNTSHELRIKYVEAGQFTNVNYTFKTLCLI